MRRLMAWLMMAMMVAAGSAWGAPAPAVPAKAPAAPHRGGIPAAPTKAAPPPAGSSKARAAKAMDSRPHAVKSPAPNQRVEMGIKPAAPESTGRYAAPDELPSNVVKVLRTSDKAQTNSYVPIVFDMKNTCPFNVIRFLRRPVQTEEGEIFTFVDETGNSGKVLLVVPPYMIPSLREVVDAVDRKGLTSSGGDIYTYAPLKHRRASATDADFLNTAASFTSGNGEVLLIDPENNALYLRDSPSGSDAAVEALGTWVDVPTPMLDLVVKVYEIDAANDLQLGLDYMAWRNGPGADLFAAGAFAEHGGFGRRENVATAPALPRNNFTASGYNYAFRYDVSSAFFDFLVTRGKGRVMIEAKLAALNTREAELVAGDQVLYYSVATADPSGIRDTGRPFQANRGRVVVGTVNEELPNKTLQPVQTGLTLKVLPVIGEQTIKLALDLKWTDYTFVDDSGFPQLVTRGLKSSLRGKIGEEILIGGLERQVAAKSTRKAPILGSIPILGWAFGGETSPAQKSELVVLITPTAVMKYNLAKTDAERDYRVKPEDQETIDQANNTAALTGPRAVFGFDQLGLDKSFGEKAADLK